MHANTLTTKLPGPEHLRARALYCSLKAHYEQKECSCCDFYQQYGVMIVKGDVFEHIRNIAACTAVVADLEKLTKAKFIELDEISTRQHRLTFVQIHAEKSRAARKKMGVPA